MKFHASLWMWGLIPLPEPALPVERIGKNHPQDFPKKCPFLANPHIGNTRDSCPYMVVQIRPKFERVCDFSTCKPSYPQIIASYPQNPCLDNGFRQNQPPKCGSHLIQYCPNQSTNIGSGSPRTGVGLLTKTSKKAPAVASCSRKFQMNSEPLQY